MKSRCEQISNTESQPRPSCVVLASRSRPVSFHGLSLFLYLFSPPFSAALLAGATGIPDFRTPGTGLYSQLEEYGACSQLTNANLPPANTIAPPTNAIAPPTNAIVPPPTPLCRQPTPLCRQGLPTPESVFQLEFFKDNPVPFCTLARELFPGQHKPTATHAFLRLLQDKGLLLRCYTQNIDTLERVAGIAPENLVEAHGSFGSASCVECQTAVALQTYRDQIDQSATPHCGCTLNIPPPIAPPAEAAVAAAREGLAVAVAGKAGKSMMDMPLAQYMDLGMAVSRAQSHLDGIEAVVAEHPAKQMAWEAGPKTRVCPGLVKSDIVFFGEKTAVGSGKSCLSAVLPLPVCCPSLTFHCRFNAFH